MFGWVGTVLKVDLSRKKIVKEPFGSSIRANYIGGRGANIKVLYDALKPGIDPLGPDNVFVVGAGPAVGTVVPSSGRFTISSKSPHTGIIGDSNAGGFFGVELKFAGYDQIIVYGKSEKPVYLWINGDDVEIKDATHLWGRTTSETDELIINELRDPEVKVAAIGPAGENLVRFANIMSCLYSGSGRTGMGAVAGSKNLKAIAVRGYKGVKVPNVERLLEIGLKKIQETLAGTSGWMSTAIYGTPATMDINNALGCNATRNSQSGIFKDADKIDGIAFAEKYSVKSKACWNCPQHCGHFYRIETGPYAGLSGAGLDYVTTCNFGSRIGNSDPESILKANNLSDDFGFDMYEAGTAIAFAMECWEKGLINEKDTDGLILEWGNANAMLELIRKMAYKEGFGAILAEGAYRASKLIGKGSEQYAMHVKGNVIPCVDPRGVVPWGLAYSVSSRGADHLRSLITKEPMEPELAERLFKSVKALDFSTTEKKGYLIKWYEEQRALLDCIGFCKFISFDTHALFLPEDLAELFNVLTNSKISGDELMKVGERVINLERAFNVREGISRKDDVLPQRYLKEPMPEGPAKGRTVNLTPMLDEYYSVRGWDSNGIPAKEKMKELGLEEIPSSNAPEKHPRKLSNR